MEGKLLSLDLKVMLSCLILVSLALTSIEEETKLILECFRQGARNPVHRVETIPLPESREYYSDLTTTGMRNHFNLGRLIRTKYYNFLPDMYTPHSIIVNSAISQINGLFYKTPQLLLETPALAQFWNPPGFKLKKPGIIKNLLPYRVHIAPIEVQNEANNYLFHGVKLCPRIVEMINKDTDQWEQKDSEKYI